jgi:hypothetical protein
MLRGQLPSPAGGKDFLPENPMATLRLSRFLGSDAKMPLPQSFLQGDDNAPAGLMNLEAQLTRSAQTREREWLDEEVGGAVLDRGAPCMLGQTCGYQNEWSLCRGRGGADFSQQLDAIHLPHVPVAYDEIEAPAADVVEGDIPVLGAHDLAKSTALQRYFQHSQKIEIVVYRQRMSNSHHRHASPPANVITYDK